MRFIEAGSIRFLEFTSLADPGIYHAIFTRRGGYSPSPWHSLNVGASVGDHPERVAQNRLAALKTLNLIPDSVYDVYQVHSTDVVITDKPLPAGENHLKADAILTDRPGVTLMMRFADCVPILLFDPVRRVVGIAHAGWIGTVGRIASKVVKTMVETYRTVPADIIAVLGPSIGPDHYAVRSEVVERVRASFGTQADTLLVDYQGATHFDLWKANSLSLQETGVSKIQVTGICTCCNPMDWYSHRGEHGTTGRFGAIIGLKQ